MLVQMLNADVLILFSCPVFPEMEKVKYPQEKVHNTQVKGKKNLKKSKKLSRVYCVLCRSSYLNKVTVSRTHAAVVNNREKKHP